MGKTHRKEVFEHPIRNKWDMVHKDKKRSKKYNNLSRFFEVDDILDKDSSDNEKESEDNNDWDNIVPPEEVDLDNEEYLEGK